MDDDLVISDEDSRLFDEGSAEGRAKAKTKVARRMFDLKFTIDDVIMATGLSKEEAEAIKEKLQRNEKK
jgi:predicted transposase/invertase (TIGR01784 family)